MALRQIIALVVLFGCAQALFGFGSKQVVAVKGKLVCNGKPSSGVTIKMYDNDVLMDSKMGETKTDSDGNFNLVGTAREITTADPKVNFYHNCDNSAVRCARKFTITVPDSYVTRGSTPKNTYDFHTMELAGKFPGESRDCIHRA